MRARLRLTPFRRAAAAAALAAGFGYANLTVALPLLAFAQGSSAAVAGVLVGANTLAFVAGAAAAGALWRTEAGMAVGLVSIAAGDLILVVAMQPSTAELATGAIVHGAGMGLFWVGTMAALGRRAGGTGSPGAFVGQYVIYTIGNAAGGVLTGATIAGLLDLGLGGRTSIRLSLLLSVFCAAAALPLVATWLRGFEDRPPPRGIPNPARGWTIQIPDLLLASSTGIFVALAPIVLYASFGFSAAGIGAVSGGVAAAKILGSIAAARIGRRARILRMAPAMLLASAGTVGALAITHAAWTFVTLLLVSVVLALGAWPVLVEGALARVPPAERFRMAIAWNMREFTVIAVATAGGGYLVHSGGAPTLLLGIAAVLLLAAAIGAAAMLRRPLHEPRGTRTGGRAPLEETFPHVVHHPNSFQPAPPRPTDTP